MTALFESLTDTQVALDYIPKVGLNWVGNVNELNAGTRAATIKRLCLTHLKDTLPMATPE